ncbi:sugar transferase [Romboutsia sp.]|uniref:sugar transferase n=1 Tax=Romboutsia sp. TaxID=1965302 RepID=UPI003F3EF9AE
MVRYEKNIKRVVDIILSLIGLLILSPVILIVSILVKVNLGSPILFKQERLGYNGEVFKIIKFRSMTNEKNLKGEILRDKDRTTKFGKILRKSSLDEIPELINVLKGEMSIVGPRPLLVEYGEYYTKEQFRRHSVRPGITGWAQTNGRTSITWSKTFKLDVWYVDNMSFLLDIKIILMTIVKVLKKSDTVDKRDKVVKYFNDTDTSTNE